MGNAYARKLVIGNITFELVPERHKEATKIALREKWVNTGKITPEEYEILVYEPYVPD